MKTATLAMLILLCTTGCSLSSGINWKSLQNPVLQYPEWSVKDYACAYRSGTYYLFFSAFYEDDGQVRSHVVEVTTKDFITYSKPVFNIDDQKNGWIGLCSPDITQVGGTWYLTLNSWGNKEGKPNQLFYMTSKDLLNWSARKPLAANLTKGMRAIDAALAHDNGKWFLFWKQDQTTRCAVSDSISGSFKAVGLPEFKSKSGRMQPWNENYHFFKTDGKWHVLTITQTDQKGHHLPMIYTMSGSGEKDGDWLYWSDGIYTRVASESFNSHDAAEATFVLDNRPVDGFFYLLYAGNTERNTYLGRGWNRLGMSRSKDLVNWSPAGTNVPAPQPVQADMLVGAYYFPGWCDESRWYCMAAHDGVLHPLLGYYREGDPEAADWHIKWALEHGISFFSFDFYTAGGSQMLETALDDGFLKSKYINQFKFCLNWCNHAARETMTAEAMERFGDIVIKKYLTHPSYLKIDGKPVVQILVGAGFVHNLGADGSKAAFDRFEQRCRDAGLPGVHFVFCEGEIGSEKDTAESFAAGADVFCRYNYPYAGSGLTGPGTHAEFPYEQLVNTAPQEWKHWQGITGGRFWPTVMPGWDRRPWTKEADVMYTNPTPELFGKTLRQAREFVNGDRIVMIEAWNEWGEGSAIEPSVEQGFGMLDQIRTTFCPDAGPHTDVDPASLGVPRPVFDLKLPSRDTWRFDSGTEGWVPVRLEGFKQSWGIISGKSTDGDPQIVSPLTYLNCADYPRLHIRMRLISPQGGPEKSEGQFFWSTIDLNMSKDTCLTFPVFLDGQWHDYDLDLSTVPAWAGRTDQVRLDPVSLAGVEIEVDEVRLGSR